ncbi:MAG: molybdopterin-dependent oxidoreductase [Anaerolineales bacterium]|nr:molybdopterin-dependent oxidoreductase [Anaerolineales bacterium]
MSIFDFFSSRKGRPDRTNPVGETQIVRTSCPAHNCGGRCLLVAHIRDGKIVRLDSDDRQYDEIDNPRLMACARGKAYLRRQYHPDRLQYPLKRVGLRGEAKFERISWGEALDYAAAEINRVMDAYGNQALLVPYGTGAYSNTNGSQLARRLFNCIGGHLDTYNSYSWACINVATPTVYGTHISGNQRQDWANSRYILMWGWNPAEMIDGTNSTFFINKARQNGAKVICIDPRKTLTAVGLADEWIPIRPGTDTAMMTAMAYVMVTENLHAADFIDSHCHGFDESQMPPGLEGQETYRDYLLGTRDGIPKTPAWAEAITAVPWEKITQIAREYAQIKPAMLYQGYGMQRRAYGEQVVRAGCVLAAISGNVGISGGWASGLALQAPDGGSQWSTFPLGENPLGVKIPVAAWDQAVLRGTELRAEDGLTGADQLETNVKLIYAVATNCLINQHMNINRSAKILADESLVEYLIVQDQFLTPTGRFADLILPVCSAFETYGLQDGWKYGEELLLMPKLVEPLGETKSDFQICADIAERLGLRDAFTEGLDERGWVNRILEQYRNNRFPEVPLVDEFEAANIGAYTKTVTKPAVAFADFRRDPQKYPLETPSGKIEIFSRALYEKGNPDEIPPIPKYIQEWESPFGAEAKTYPLQAMGSHTLHRVHSTHDNNDWLEEAFPQRIYINELDAKARSIEDGDWVRVFNERGEMIIPCRVTGRILPGVVDIPSGAWWTPDEAGIDRRGAVNVLTSERLTPLAFGNAQHTIMVQVKKAKRRRK